MNAIDLSKLVAANKEEVARAAAFHIDAKTPLRRLANSVRWFEATAKHTASRFDKYIFIAKANFMRAVISAVFAHRDINGEYAD